MQTRENPKTEGIDLDHGAFGRHGLSDVVTHFDRCGYVPLPGLLPEETVAVLREEIAAVLPLSNRKDFVMECMDNTPRHMTTVSGLAIAERSPAIVDLYHDPQLIAGISSVVGRSLEAAGDPVERHVLNMLHEAGDTHGFHTDDYPVALVMFIESPDCPDGCGRLEFCPVENAHDAQTRSHAVGDAYVLRSDRLKHRVQPIHNGCRRTVLNFAYSVEGEPVEQTPSASLLYT
ncbi:MAG: hypothetical protein OES24_04005 [Acidimicrobiia bacterium]|nr:hypothetical protein [Acidimicrobiia bacterium]